ncbi:MAG TPA: tetratricopeptide repeat protein [Candidatus Acidoferrum sp.]|nr:tetratricopeptide repeat protein [Candidatus Acidoferrum sp.]
MTYLQTALRSRPDYFDALYNLGAALAMQNNFAAAVGEFLAAVRLNPQDANAEANLGAALAELGNWKKPWPSIPLSQMRVTIWSK